MFHKVCKWCKNNPGKIIIFGTILSFLIAAFIIGFIAKEKMENMSPEEVAQNHREQVAGTCDNLDNLTKKSGVRNGADLDTEECVLVTQVNLKTSGEDIPLIGEYRVNVNEIWKNSEVFGSNPVIKEAEGKIQKLCYEGKPVHIVDGHAEGVYLSIRSSRSKSVTHDSWIRRVILALFKCVCGMVPILVGHRTQFGLSLTTTSKNAHYLIRKEFLLCLSRPFYF